MLVPGERISFVPCSNEMSGEIFKRIDEPGVFDSGRFAQLYEDSMRSRRSKAATSRFG